MIKRSRGRKYLLMALGLALATTGVGLAAYVVDKSHIETDVPVESNDRTVCYNESTGVYYTSIEKAMSEVQGSVDNRTSIYVIPELTNDDGSLYQIHIKEDLTVPSHAVLMLPYSGTTVRNYDDHGSFTASPYFADGTEALVKEYRKTQVIVDQGVTITIQGYINIGGVIGNPTQTVAGNTAGAYTEMTLSANSSIIVESGGGA